MSKAIRLTPTLTADAGPLRLHAFAGRHLSEQDLDLLHQAYADRRCDPLLRGLAPGILEGLAVRISAAPGAAGLRVQPGRALGGDGRVLRVFYAIDEPWDTVAAVYKDRRDAAGQPVAPLHGFYFLTIRREVALVDDQDEAPACRRTEPDPLRDSRLESFATLDLQWLGADAELLAMAPARAANRLCVRHLGTPVFDPVSGAVPIALLKVVNDQLDLNWTGLEAGRFAARTDAPYHTLLEQTVNALNRSTPVADPGKPLAEVLGLDFLPAAGPFPQQLLSDIAGHLLAPPSATTPLRWSTPATGFLPQDLQLELVPVPASTVAGVLQRELPRGVVDLRSGRGDRLRLMVAVEDADYRTDLLDLPATDAALEGDLRLRATQARAAYDAWAQQFLTLFNRLDEGALEADGQPGAAALARFQGIDIPAGPVHAFPELADLDAAGRKALGIAPGIGPPLGPETFFQQLVDTREAELEAEGGKTLPPPYAFWQGGDDQEPTPVGSDQEGLYREQLRLDQEIALLERELDANDDLLGQFDAFLGLQRQQMDSVTVSFSSLAGGVPGDGTGLQLARWMPFTQLQPVAGDDAPDGNG